MPLKILHEDDRILVVDKPPGMSVEDISGLPAHRLDKDTSGVLLIAKNKETLESLQKEFKERKVEKRYVCLVEGNVKQEHGIIHTLLARSPADRRKQRTYALGEQTEGKREALTTWKVLKRFENYTLLEVTPKTGRKHQIRTHMVFISHPIAGDKLYGFKTQSVPEGLTRQFLHASYLKVEDKEFTSALPEDLEQILEKLQMQDDNTN